MTIDDTAQAYRDLQFTPAVAIRPGNRFHYLEMCVDEASLTASRKTEMVTGSSDATTVHCRLNDHGDVNLDFRRRKNFAVVRRFVNWHVLVSIRGS